jgi:zinc/manganese transport system substrate-binding protein
MQPLVRILSTVAVVAVSLAACTADDDAPPTGVSVVTTTTVFGDIVERIVGADGSVEVLIPVGVDPHEFQLSAQQIARLMRADLVVANGLGLEEGMEDALSSAAQDGVRVLSVGEQLDPLPFGTHDDSDHQDADHGTLDPHVWMDPLRMADAAQIVAAELGATLGGEVDWVGRGEAVASEILAMHEQLQDLLETIPRDRRILVTNHDALGYLADRYGLEVVGVIIPGGSTMGEPSSAQLADLVATIRETGAPAIFADTTDPSSLAEAIASEVGESVDVVDLYTGSIGEPGSGADSYAGMMLTNGRRIATALGGTP